MRRIYSDRVCQVVIGLAEGKSVGELAFEWHRSMKTVAFHWALAKKRLGLRCYQDAVKFALKNGWITL
jgi:DNA-binding NarL/FixJ family response regulator